MGSCQVRGVRRLRNRPFFDLTARITADRAALVVDLGCGPGNLTATLAERWPDATVTGMDSSRRWSARHGSVPIRPTRSLCRTECERHDCGDHHYAF